MAEADRPEILVVDSDDKVQRGLAQLLADSGLSATIASDAAQAQAQLGQRSFAVVLLDLDTPHPDAGFELLRHCRAQAPDAAIIVMASRPTFESAAMALRLGADDIVAKSPAQVQYLQERTVELAGRRQRGVVDGALAQEVLAVYEEFLRRLMEVSRRLAEATEPGEGNGLPAQEEGCAVLVVEEDGWLAEQLTVALRLRGGYSVVTAAAGGEGIDKATATCFQLALVRDTLPDLTGSMVVSALKAQSPDTITILYSRPEAQPGRAEVIEYSRAIALLPEFTHAEQLVERFDELRQAFRLKARERRHLAAFRQEHYELLRRYAELKLRLQRNSAP